MSTDRVTAWAQVLLSVVFLTGYFIMLAVFLLGYVHVAPVWRDQIGVLLGTLTGGVGIILSFWFSRTRSQEPK